MRYCVFRLLHSGHFPLSKKTPGNTKKRPIRQKTSPETIPDNDERKSRLPGTIKI